MIIRWYSVTKTITIPAPLAEQKRIAARLEALLPLCEQLK